jgi:hypothetical protein
MVAIALMSWIFIKAAAGALCAVAYALRYIAVSFSRLLDFETRMHETQAKHNEDMETLREEMMAMQQQYQNALADCKRTISELRVVIVALSAMQMAYIAYKQPNLFK